MINKDQTSIDLRSEKYKKKLFSYLLCTNPRAYLFFVLEDMSRLHNEITTADTASLFNMTRTIYNKEEPNYGYKVRFRCGTVQKVSR